ncbi:FkbM family methyltransferase [Bernardetia sp. ABR2-2B]|uniref:FkbM family methyltransferase n=1 Tax=Bernardetia sp. ABR2-2B TaxID=3127472 RepID=UPI0030D4C634
MSLSITLKHITSHPLTKKQKVAAIFRYFKWQLQSRLDKGIHIVPFVASTKLAVQSGMTGATGNIYTGLHEFNDMGFLLHFLRSTEEEENDYFMDIGANIGSYTVLAAGVIGTQTTSIEPIPNTYQKLQKNIQVNNLATKTTALNIGLGSAKGTLQFTKSLDTVNHVATEEIPQDERIDVSIEKVDEVAKRIPILVKIDVEGFETEVINGGEAIFSSPLQKAIIIELNGSGGRYGYDESKIHQKLKNWGYKPYFYNPLKRELIEIKLFGNHNTIYCKDIDFIEKRIKTAPLINVLGEKF